MSLIIADQPERIHRNQPNATIIRGHHHALPLAALHERDPRDLPAPLILPVVVPALGLREIPQSVGVVEDHLPVEQPRGAEPSAGAERHGGDHRGRLDPLEDAALRDGPDAELAVHGPGEEVALFLGEEVDGGDHVSEREQRGKGMLVAEFAEAGRVVQVP